MQCSSCRSVVDGSARYCPACGAPQNPALAHEGPPVDPLLGQTLGGKYKVLRLLGEGGMGAVYEGEQQLGTTKRRVAIKTLHPHLSRDPSIEARFQREVATIAELEHPNTIQVYDFGSSAEGTLYIVMEFLQGRSLAQLLAAEGAMDPSGVAHVLEQVCGSLEEAHSRGIVHRDLKPDNVVLVSRAGQKDFVKVLDFGIAKRSKEEDALEQKLTQQGMVLGTPPYMSPEQFTGQPIDSRSDIYSLAIMTYEMLTGKLPFHATTAWEWASQHMTQQPIPIESLAEGERVPTSMRRALERALSKAPDQRFQSVREFIEAFEGHGLAPTQIESGGPDPHPTEPAAALDLAVALGAPAFGPGGRRGVTPAAGNMALPTPGESLRPPAGKPLRRAGPLAVAGLLGLATAVAIAVAERGATRGPPKAASASASSVPAAPLAAARTPETPGPTDPSSPPPAIPALIAGAPQSASKPLHPVSRPPPVSSIPSSRPEAPTAPAAYSEPAQAAILPVPAPTGANSPTNSPLPAATSAPRYDGVECQKARLFRAINRPREAQGWSLACIAKGGEP
jgi:serine/threonine-protein kinase